MDVWVIVEHRGGKVLPITAELCTAARKIGTPVALVLTDSREILSQLSSFGFEKILLAESPHLAHYSPRSYLSVLLPWAKEKQPAALLAGHTSFGWDLMPRLGLALSGSVATGVLELCREGEELLCVRPVYGDKILSKERLLRRPWVLTVASGAFEEAKGETKEEVEVFSQEVEAPDWEFVGVEETPGSHLRLEEAEVVVSGGRGLKDKEKFEELIFPLAELLGGAVGASRPVVDDGWLPKAHQVGSSGKVVKPKLYFAIGISGQTQHIAGMKNSQCIIAINKDPEAPIFDYAHYGVVGDLFEIVPRLIERLREVKQG